MRGVVRWVGRNFRCETGHYIVRMAQDAIGSSSSSSSFSSIQTLLSRHPRRAHCCLLRRHAPRSKKEKENSFAPFLSRFVFAANKSLIVSRNPQHRNEAVWFTGGGSPIAHVNLLNSRDGSCRRYYAFSKRCIYDDDDYFVSD